MASNSGTGGLADSRAIRLIRCDPGRPVDTSRWPATVPAVEQMLCEGLELPPGLTILVGENGSGKSTMLKCLAKILRPDKGSVTSTGKMSALLELGAGFHPELTGRENIFLNGAILGIKKADILRKFEEIVEFAEVGKFIDTPVKHYSSGMYTRLGFSIAAHVDPEVLIVDEVLSVGDYVFQQRCMDRMHSIIHSGTTVLFVSHNLKAVTEICTRTMLLERGKALAIDETGAVIRKYLKEGIPSTKSKEEKSVYISKVTMRDRAGEQSTFESGQKAWVDVEVTARKAIDKLAVVIWFTDQTQYIIFHTSTERLGFAPFSLQPGGTYRCTFELDLNIAHGTFQLVTEIYRYDIQKSYDRYYPVTTIFVGSTTAVGGAVNCFPRLIESETFAPSGQPCEV